MKSLSVRKPSVHLAGVKGVKTGVPKTKGVKLPKPKGLSMTDVLKKVKW